MSYDLDTIKKELASGDAQLFDVREQEEWDAGHLKDAALVPLSSLNEGACLVDLDKSKKVYLHCRSGQRVLSAAPILEDLGFDSVTPLGEGFDALVSEGFEEAE